MEKILKVGDISIQVSPAKDKNGRKGFFISQKNLKNIKVTITSKKIKVPQSAIRPEVEQSLREMRDYKNGKLTPRSIDDVLRSI